MVRIEWTERSYNYIARDSKTYANLFIKKIYNKVQKLKDFPNLGRIAPEINNLFVREIIFQIIE